MKMALLAAARRLAADTVVASVEAGTVLEQLVSRTWAQSDVARQAAVAASAGALCKVVELAEAELLAVEQVAS
jgi:hypothetical protein